MITVKCTAPKRLKGRYEFRTYEEFARWLGKTRLSRVSNALVAVAERGRFGAQVYGRDFDITGPPRGYAAKELARQVGVIRVRGGGDVYSKDPERAVEFARHLDRVHGNA